MTTTEKTKPVHEIRLGTVKAAVWANSSEKGMRYSVTVTRMYKPEQDKPWKFSDSFGRDELPVLAAVATEAHRWILGRLADANAASPGEEAVNI